MTDMTNTQLTKTTTPVKKSKPRAKRKSFKEIRLSEREFVLAGQRAYYEPKLQTLAEEIGLLQGRLEEARGTLDAIQGSWITALVYWAKGRI
jgi:hypothetical protein